MLTNYTIGITASLFGNCEHFYTQFSKGNRRVIIEHIEFEGIEDEEHCTGYLIDTFECKNDIDSLKLFTENYLLENGFNQECFSIYKSSDLEKTTILTEDDLN